MADDRRLPRTVPGRPCRSARRDSDLHRRRAVTLSHFVRTAAVVLVAAAAAPGAVSAAKDRPSIALSATPAHMTLLGRIPQTLLVRNDGTSPVLLLARRA